jgi:phage FluMu gp28-like protein
MNANADLKKVLLRYQRDWIADKSAVKVIEKSRQIGLTWAEAADDTLIASVKGQLRPDEQLYYIGYVKEMAREFIDTCAMWAQRFDKAYGGIQEIEYEDEYKQGDKMVIRKIQAFQMEFATGHRIMALSSAPRNLRGKHGIVVIDEAAFHDDLNELVDAALALLTWGGKIRIISTHNGVDNPFAELISAIRMRPEKYSVFSVHTTTLDDAIADGLYQKIAEATGQKWSAEAEANYRQMSIEKYRDREIADQELFCVPLRGGGAYIPTTLIEQCQNEKVPVLRWAVEYSFLEKKVFERMKEADDWIAEKLAPVMADKTRVNPDLMSCFGADIGRSGAPTVFWPMQLGPLMVRRTPFVIELRNLAYGQQKQVLNYMIDHLPRFVAGAIDATGLGNQLAQETQDTYGQRIDAVMLQIDWYRQNMPRYKAAFEDKTIELPKDFEILADHRSIKVDRTGVPRIAEQPKLRVDLGGQRHGDSAIAGAMAYYASTMPKAEYAYTPGVAARRPSSWSDEDPSARDAYEDARAMAGSRGGWRERLGRFGKGTW